MLRTFKVLCLKFKVGDELSFQPSAFGFQLSATKVQGFKSSKVQALRTFKGLCLRFKVGDRLSI